MAYSLQRDVWSALGPLPPALRTFDARPILSVGVKAADTLLAIDWWSKMVLNAPK
ncbi:unnamed protein product [Effrenium voratum]|uniref:Uncharacterized protein n=1 Tax=Effrenium voratum TaxID=2562239 RepID=A0AA36IB86_9DINO|nr:unnamed protein product [Effrenium voratum]